jgi:NADP-dependent 3-hydroxy acid dehydrogenase YdfG
MCFYNIIYIFLCRRTCCYLGRLVLPGMGPYCMTKHAVTALANVLRFELKQWGITVHDIQPAFFRQVVCLLLIMYC